MDVNTSEWRDIASPFSDLYNKVPPISGRTQAFSHLENKWNKVHSDSESSLEDLRRISRTDRSRVLSGEAADEIRDATESLVRGLSDLPEIAQSVAEIAAAHKLKLENLKTQATLALNRARVLGDQREAAQTRVVGQQRVVEELARQVEQVKRAGNTSELKRVSDQLSTEKNSLRVRQSEFDSSIKTLSGYLRPTLTTLRSEEDELDKSTAAAFDRIHLGNLKDPNWAQRTLEAAGKAALWAAKNLTGVGVLKLLKETWEFIKATVKALGPTLFKIMDALGKASQVLGWVSLALVVLNVLTGGLLTPILSVVVALQVIVAGAKFGLGLLLATTGATDPETGEKYSWGEVIIDGVVLVLSMASFNGIKNIKLSTNAQAISKNWGWFNNRSMFGENGLPGKLGQVFDLNKELAVNFFKNNVDGFIGRKFLDEGASVFTENIVDFVGPDGLNKVARWSEKRATLGAD
jgi:hypothetical protein